MGVLRISKAFLNQPEEVFQKQKNPEIHLMGSLETYLHVSCLQTVIALILAELQPLVHTRDLICKVGQDDRISL